MSRRIDMPAVRGCASSSEREGREGFTLIEVVLSLTVLAVALLALGSTVLSSMKTTASIESRARIRAQALRYMERFQRLPFGDVDDAAATTEELDALFADAAEIPAISLVSIRRPPDGDGHRFRLAGFEEDGSFEVRVNEDANGNGVVDGSEDTFDLFRVEVLFDGRPVLTTFRSRRVEID